MKMILLKVPSQLCDILITFQSFFKILMLQTSNFYGYLVIISALGGPDLITILARMLINFNL